MKKSALRGIFILGFLLVTGWPSRGLAQVPAPSSSPADRIGIYAWGFEATAWQSQTNGQLDRLNWAADKASVIGSRTIRVTLPGAVYGLPVGGDLAEVAAGPEYDKLFTDPRFKTYLLNSRINVFANGTDTPFSVSGNRIHIEQMMNSFLVSADNAPDFTESSLQLSVTLPSGLRPGSAFIQALDAAGVETQGQTVVFNCDACPAITEITDSDRNLGEFHPGTIIDIHGRNFSMDGNSVIIEQQDVLTGRYRFTVAAEDVLFESTTRLRVKLPSDLIISRFNVVVVASRNGLESNMQALRAFPYSGITPPCPDCAPVISLPAEF